MASIRDSGFWFMPGGHTFVLVLVLWFCSALTTSEDLTTNSHAESWLRRYGYLQSTDSSSRPSRSIQDLSEPIREMQRFYNLEVTGQMDQQTTTAMQRPRCGVPDKTNEGLSSYNVLSDKWDKFNLTYSIENFAPKLAWHETSHAIRRAFTVWEKVSPFHFEGIPYNDIYNGLRDEADIMISFHAGPHKGHAPFGLLELAHASSPPRRGEGALVHFNLDKQWSISNQNMEDFYNVFLVAVHELGHSLGLDHSSDPTSIMYPDYKWMNTENFQLPVDDCKGIQHIYSDGNPAKTNCEALTLENCQLRIETLMRENSQFRSDNDNLRKEKDQLITNYNTVLNEKNQLTTNYEALMSEKNQLSLNTIQLESEVNLLKRAALLQLQVTDSPLCAKETTFVKTACLPNQLFPDGTQCVVSGWGRTSETQRRPVKLSNAVVPLISKGRCMAPHVYGDRLDDSMICAGHLAGGVSACTGDGGGPLMCQENGVHYVAGIVSWGEGCGRKDKPDVYANVYKFREWITRMMSTNSSDYPDYDIDYS